MGGGQSIQKTSLTNVLQYCRPQDVAAITFSETVKYKGCKICTDPASQLYKTYVREDQDCATAKINLLRFKGTAANPCPTTGDDINYCAFDDTGLYGTDNTSDCNDDNYQARKQVYSKTLRACNRVLATTRAKPPADGGPIPMKSLCPVPIFSYLKCDPATHKCSYKAVSSDPATVAACQNSFDLTLGAVTISVDNPATLTFATPHGLTSRQEVFLRTSGVLPTGLVPNTTYFVGIVDSLRVRLASSAANLDSGIFIATSGTQSGAHTLLESCQDSEYVADKTVWEKLDANCRAKWDRQNSLDFWMPLVSIAFMSLLLIGMVVSTVMAGAFAPRSPSAVAISSAAGGGALCKFRSGIVPLVGLGALLLGLWPGLVAYGLGWAPWNSSTSFLDDSNRDSYLYAGIAVAVVAALILVIWLVALMSGPCVAGAIAAPAQVAAAPVLSAPPIASGFGNRITSIVSKTTP